MNYKIDDQQLKITIDEEFSGQSLAELFDYFCLSSKWKYLLMQEKKVLLNGQVLTDSDVILNSGDELTFLNEESQIDFPLATESCEVVYEDDFVYIAHKKAVDIIHDDTSADALANQAARYQYEHHIDAPVHYIHRLDRETSGLVLFVKYPLFNAYYDRKLAEKEIQRYYLAIVKGKGNEGYQATFKDPIGRDRHHSGRYIVYPKGKSAVTHIKVLRKKGPYLLVEAHLETGRTHQIRVHLAYHNMPIVNDDLYGIKDAHFPAMGLWAYKIIFDNPLTHETIEVRDHENEMFNEFN